MKSLTLNNGHGDIKHGVICGIPSLTSLTVYSYGKSNKCLKLLLPTLANVDFRGNLSTSISSCPPLREVILDINEYIPSAKESWYFGLKKLVYTGALSKILPYASHCPEMFVDNSNEEISIGENIRRLPQILSLRLKPTASNLTVIFSLLKKVGFQLRGFGIYMECVPSHIYNLFKKFSDAFAFVSVNDDRDGFEYASVRDEMGGAGDEMADETGDELMADETGDVLMADEAGDESKEKTKTIAAVAVVTGWGYKDTWVMNTPNWVKVLKQLFDEQNC